MAYAEELFHNAKTWDYVLSEEPSFKDRVLSFFKGANKKYSFEPGMTKAAKKWLSEYKKLFNEVSAYNKSQSAAQNAVASEGVKKIERLGRVVGNAEFGIRNEEFDDGSRAAIKTDAKGNKYVEVDARIINNDDSIDKIAEVLSEIVQTKFADFVCASGQKIGVNQKTAKEWIRSKSATTLLKYSKQTFLDKANAFGNADEILKTAKNYIGEAKKHSRKDNFVEFARGVVTFSFEGRGYEADVIVGTTKSGAAVLYDLVDIQSKKIVAGASYTTQDRRSDASTTNNSIPYSEEKSNSFDKKTSKDFKNSAESGKNVDDWSSSSTAAAVPLPPFW